MKNPLNTKRGLAFKRAWRYYRGWKWIVFIGLFLALVTTTYLVVLAKTTSVETLQDALQTQTVIYDNQDEYVGALNSQKGNYVTLDNISDEMMTTVIQVEDKRFYEHNGFDTMGIGRAAIRLLLNRDTSGGGGSTITQQLAKNAFLSLDQTIQRKLKELFLALEIEKVYSKNEILEMYLNHAYFGNGVWGVEDASQKYFGHSAVSLNWNESAVLTGILKGPSLFNPIDDYDAAIERRNTVLSVLENNGVLDANQVASIQNEGIYLYDNYYATDAYTYPYYFDAVIDEAVEKAKIPEADLIAKGYRIYTHLDQGYQYALDQAYANDWMFPDEATDEPLVQSASVVVDPSTGGVAALYGGRGEYVYRGFNRATDMHRLPGSTIKPMAVYVPALENGYHIHSMVPDEVKSYGSDGWTPQNYDLQTDPDGEVPLYYALAQSKNTTAVALMDKLGVNTAVRKLNQFGIDVPQQDQSLTLALGAFGSGVTVEQLANAYSAFANDGVRNESSLIRRIEDVSGNVVYQNEKPTKHLVMTKNVAKDMTSMMLDTFGGYGTSYGAGPDYGQIAGKSGSTEVSESSQETRDRWMVGYTPDFVIATWVGLDQEGEQSLDDLMPAGMGALFNQQTTLLMNQSPQTPFDVQMASQMENHTNTVDDEVWYDTANQWLNQSSEWINQQVDQWLPQISQAVEELGHQISDAVSSFEWPF